MSAKRTLLKNGCVLTVDKKIGNFSKGDVLIEDLAMPRVEMGELIAIPSSGAYQLSMSSNYNGARRPAVIWLEGGRARLIVRRETVEDLSQRDLPLS